MRGMTKKDEKRNEKERDQDGSVACSKIDNFFQDYLTSKARASFHRVPPGFWKVLTSKF